MMQIRAFFADEDMSDEEKIALEDAGVDLDDWDCILICPVESIELRQYDHIDPYTSQRSIVREYKPKSFYLERLIERSSSYNSLWHKAIFQGEEVAIGVAYHS